MNSERKIWRNAEIKLEILNVCRVLDSLRPYVSYMPIFRLNFSICRLLLLWMLTLSHRLLGSNPRPNRGYSTLLVCHTMLWSETAPSNTQRILRNAVIKTKPGHLLHGILTVSAQQQMVLYFPTTTVALGPMKFRTKYIFSSLARIAELTRIPRSSDKGRIGQSECVVWSWY